MHFVILFAFLLLSTFSLGQDLRETSLEELGSVQVYSACKHAQSTSEAPSSVTVITAMRSGNLATARWPTSCAACRGFYVTYDRADYYLGVRGVERSGDYNSMCCSCWMVIGSIDNVYDMALIGREFPIAMDLIDRVEIIRGPSSSLYGTNAFFAVINVITRTRSQLSGFEVSFEPSSFGAYKGHASYGGRYKGLDMVLSNGIYGSEGRHCSFLSSTHQR